MPQVVQNLLLIYAAAVLINTVSSGALYFKSRGELARAQLLIWAAALVALIFQAVLQGSLVLVLLGLTSVFLASLAITDLITRVAGLRAYWRLYGLLLLVGWGATLIGLWRDYAFAAVTLPVLIGVAFPILSSSAEMLFRHWRSLSLSERGLGISAFAYGLHMLDFCILGDKPEYMGLGFTLAVLSVFTLSIFIPSVVVEKITANTARTAAELDAARRIQKDLLPAQPAIPGLMLACYMKPAEEVGGDYYDIFEAEHRTWLLLGDVTGHGLSSGLVMLMAQSIISSILHTQGDIPPGELNVLANRILTKNLRRLNEERTMTIVSMCIEPSGELILSGAHDNIFIHRHATDDVEVVPVGQFPFGLGLMDDVPKEVVGEARYPMGEGDTLFIITDGVTEAAREGEYDKGLFGEDRLMTFIRESARLPVEAIKQALVRQLTEFTQGIFHDDVTFIIARVGRA